MPGERSMALAARSRLRHSKLPTHVAPIRGIRTTIPIPAFAPTQILDDGFGVGKTAAEHGADKELEICVGN